MKQITQDLTFSGIYCIINLKNNKWYIGSSKNIRLRLWDHRSTLRHNNHDNPHLQNAWNKYGEEYFDYYIIERCDEQITLEREQYYLDLCKPQYNINTTTFKPPCTPETRKKQSITRKAKMATGEIPITHNKHIYKYDLNGNFLEEYISIRRAAAANNMCPSQIFHMLNGQHKQGGGFLWSYTKEERLPKYVKNNKKPCRTKYIITNIHTNEQYEFLGVKECSEFLNVHECHIGNAIKNDRIVRTKYKIKRQTAVQ
jgi:group I intron endonuclease